MPAIRLAVDTSGGDFAPREIIAGAISGAAQQPAIELVLVGRPGQIQAQLQQHDTRQVSIEIVEAPDVIEMGEDPAFAVRRKKQASIVVACELVQAGRADAVVTMGHTGAGLVAALLAFGRLPGIERPAAIVPYLGFADTFLIDVGANTEVSPYNLLQFALMGSLYVEKVIGMPRPRVALLANGTEPNKGNAIGRQAFPLLAASGLNFIGNIEGTDLPQGRANVIVSDGFTLNIALKLSEELVGVVLKQVAAECGERADGLTGVLDRVRQRHDYARHGASLLLGVNGLIFIGHGRSQAAAVATAIGKAAHAVEVDLLAALRAGFAQGKPG